MNMTDIEYSETLLKDIKAKMDKARMVYFSYLGTHDIEYTINIFKAMEWRDNDERDSEIYSSIDTPFYAAVVRRVEEVLGKEGMGDVAVLHGGNVLFIIFQDYPNFWWPNDSDFSAEWKKEKYRRKKIQD